MPVLIHLSRWIARQLSPQPAPRISPISDEMLDALRKALRNGATPVGAHPQPLPDRAFMLRSAARSTQIVGHMMDGISDSYKFVNKPAAFFVKMGRICFGMVEAAMPRSLANLCMQYWFKLLLIVEIVMIVGGTLIKTGSVQTLGVKLLILTLGFRALIEIIRLYLEGMKGPRTIAVLVALVALALLWWGTVHFREVILPSLEKRLPVSMQKSL